MFSFQTKYLTCLSSIDSDDPKKSVNRISENQTYRRESCDRFSRVMYIYLYGPQWWGYVFRVLWSTVGGSRSVRGLWHVGHSGIRAVAMVPGASPCHLCKANRTCAGRPGSV